MEGPSLFLAAEQLDPFIGKKIAKVSGNTKIGKERLHKEKVLDIFCWGKHLVFQFETFALRVHFLLYGSFEAIVREKKVTGDYPKKTAPTRLELHFSMGIISMFNCSLRFIEDPHAIDLYDYSIDVMSPEWSPKKALKQCKLDPKREICDVLLDQTIFAGVGNIIKNETLFIEKVHPQTLIGYLSDVQLKALIETAVTFSHQFYVWRKASELRAHYQIYRQSKCPQCGGKVYRKKTGNCSRFSFFCSDCQKINP